MGLIEGGSIVTFKDFGLYGINRFSLMSTKL